MTPVLYQETTLDIANESGLQALYQGTTSVVPQTAIEDGL
jgi:hypothetical protein